MQVIGVMVVILNIATSISFETLHNLLVISKDDVKDTIVASLPSGGRGEGLGSIDWSRESKLGHFGCI